MDNVLEQVRSVIARGNNKPPYRLVANPKILDMLPEIPEFEFTHGRREHRFPNGQTATLVGIYKDLEVYRGD